MKRFLLSLVVTWVGAQAPIPNRPVGWVYDPTGVGFVANPIEVQVHVDLQCPDCSAAWPSLIKMADHYRRNVKLSVLVFPLPYHRAAYKLAMGAQVVGNSKSSPGSVYEYADLMFSNQDAIHAFANTANDTMLVDYVTGILAKDATFAPFAAAFSKGMQNENMDWLARVDWKFACSLGTSGTPFPYVNRVLLDQGIPLSLAEWQKLIDPMLTDENNVL